MKKIVVFFLVLAVIAGGAWFYFNAVNQPNGDISPQEDLRDKELLPWVEVHVPGVFVKKFGEVVNTPLKTGDEITAGDTIITDNSGLTTVHLPDGSVFRLDINSEVTLTDFIFQNENNRLGIKLLLTVGRVWNKIISLATPDSYWQVETGNAVAAVRGTAFGVEYLPGKSFFIGGENEVAVDAIDPENHEVILNNTAIVGPDEMLEITDEMVKNMKENNLRLDDQVRSLNSGVGDRVWIQRAQTQDGAIDAQKDDLLAGGLSEAEARQILKIENYEEKTAIQERNAGIFPSASTNDAPVSSSEDNNEKTVSDNPADDTNVDGGDNNINLLNVPVTNLNTNVVEEDDANNAVTTSVKEPSSVLVAPIKLNSAVLQPIKNTSSLIPGNTLL